MRRLALKLRGRDAVHTIQRVYRWVREHHKRYRGDQGAVLRRRTAAQLFRVRTLSGCGDWGLLQASLLRAAGLPTVFVEAVQKDWAEQHRLGTGGRRYYGHIFLEVHTKLGWVLVDSTRPYLWRGHDPAEPNLPRGYYLLGKGRDPWDIGVRDHEGLRRLMDELAEQTPPSRFKEVRLRRELLLPQMQVIGPPDTVKRLRRKLKSVAVTRTAPRDLARWLSRCDRCEALVLLPSDLAERHTRELVRVLGRYTRLGPLSELVKTTPRFLSLPRARLCLYVRDTDDELIRLGQRHAGRPITAATCR
jgi:hypothetical protein